VLQSGAFPTPCIASVDLCWFIGYVSDIQSHVLDIRDQGGVPRDR
jgi:hypothetical protein